MKINIGSKAPPKVEALRELSNEYDILKGAEIIVMDVDSGVKGQPEGFDEIVKGAKNRAKSSFKDCSLSFGLESGIVPVPGTKSGYIDLCCCAIFDGKEFHLGTSMGFEYPKKVMELIKNEGLDASRAAKKVGLTEQDYIGHDQGLIGILTKGRVNRKEYSKQSIIAAMIHLENKGLY
jgi:inosine/xanthosine triphosphatase